MVSIMLTSCAPLKTRSVTENSTDVNSLVSYQRDIKPMMRMSCTPCHFPERGRGKMLNTYEATKFNINEILRRVQLPPGHNDAMPYKEKKLPLSNEQVELIKKWVAGNFNR